jgi:hypothetical protein
MWEGKGGRTWTPWMRSQSRPPLSRPLSPVEAHTVIPRICRGGHFSPGLSGAGFSPDSEAVWLSGVSPLHTGLHTNHFTIGTSGSEVGSYLRRIHFCITQL